MGTLWGGRWVLPLLMGAMLVSACSPALPAYEFWFENRTSQTLTVFQLLDPPSPDQRENTARERLLVELPPGARRGTGGPIYLWAPSQTFQVDFRIREASGRIRYATLRQPTVDVPAYLLIISEAGLDFVTAAELLGEGTPVVRKPPAPPTPAAGPRASAPDEKP